ncbi:MAG TPA: hypothetical protein VLM36_07875 [Sphingomicrobium sp.]|nr:hypothetical protein [Sphingomicrobium sp.]
MSRIFLVLAATAAMALPGRVFAQPSPAQSSNAAAPPSRLICEKQSVTGSRLGSKEVCLTPEQFAQRRRQEREAVERAQAAPCMPTATDPQGHPLC